MTNIIITIKEFISWSLDTNRSALFAFVFASIYFALSCVALLIFVGLSINYPPAALIVIGLFFWYAIREFNKEKTNGL